MSLVGFTVVDSGYSSIQSGPVTMSDSTFDGHSYTNWRDNSTLEVLDTTNVVRLERVTFDGNDGGVGSAIAVEAAPEFTCRDCRFVGNTALEGIVAIHDTPVVDLSGSVFEDNTASDRVGALYLAGGGSVDLTGAEFRRNTATSGCGAVSTAVDPSGTLTVAGGLFEDNDGGFEDGGAWCHSGGSLELTGATFGGNTAAGDGGALFSEESVSLTAVTFDGNTAGGWGGAVALTSSGSVVDSSFTANDATESGGAVAWTTALTVTNSDLSTGATDNAPNDLAVVGRSGGQRFDGLTSVTCTLVTCQ